MTDAPSPWPEHRRTQAVLLGTGTLLLVVAGLALAGVVALSETATVGATAVATALLIYGLLGWAGQWVEEDEADAVDEDGSAGDREPAPGEEGPPTADEDVAAGARGQE